MCTFIFKFVHGEGSSIGYCIVLYCITKNQSCFFCCFLAVYSVFAVFYVFCVLIVFSVLTVFAELTVLAVLTIHCEIYGSYLQKHHQHPVLRALFFRQSHTARDREIKKYCPIRLLGTS